LDWLGMRGIEITRSQGFRIARLAVAHSVDVVIDVGARRGEFGRMVRANGYRGRLLSFEPVEENFRRLKRRCNKDPWWECYQLALGSAAACMDIHIMRDSAFSSFRPVSPFGRERFGRMVDVVETVQVDVVRLDDLWPEISKNARRVLLKLDTQGWDLEVLAGCKTVLDLVEVVQIEVSFRSVYDGSPSWADSIAMLTSQGFGIAHLFPVSSPGQDGELIEGDCILVRMRHP
jgi:FkbM family methyltransferase